MVCVHASIDGSALGSEEQLSRWLACLWNFSEGAKQLKLNRDQLRPYHSGSGGDGVASATDAEERATRRCKTRSSG
jgi:hypothetical protein